ncbi:MAG: hypothetical protein EOO51_15280 [Flavobacterium sp.]|nr:MAG: hypothetical protein EOO51_15280 [Flavobacterium sp.]
MSTISLTEKSLARLIELDNQIAALNTEKIKLLLASLGLTASESDFEKMLDWDLIIITVPDKQMGTQLNRLCAYVPNLKFVVDKEAGLFKAIQGSKGKRVWKDR